MKRVNPDRSFFIKGLWLLVVLGAFFRLLPGWVGASEVVAIRIGHFPNLTHAQTVIGHADHWFEKGFSSNATVEWKVFNAGPSAIEALFAGQLDIATIGPSPAINGYVKSDGEALRVIAGAASGGAALLVRQDSGIESIEDFRGRKIASPQLGNTQDVALRSWLVKKGLKTREVGGDVQVIPISNADQQTLMLKKEIDGAWTVEPWVSMLVQKAGGKVYLEEAVFWPDGKYATTLVIVRKKFLDEHPDLVRQFLKTHKQLTDWINQNPAEAQRVLKAEIERETGKEFPESILQSALPRIVFSTDAMEVSVIEQGKAAFRAGFLKKEPDLTGLFDLKLLNEIIQEEKAAS